MPSAQPSPLLSIRSLHHQFQRGELSPLGLTEDILRRSQSSPPGVLVDIFRQRALAEARASQQRWQAGQPLGLFDGIPCVWKDLYDVAGSVTTAGSPAYRQQPAATSDAPVVATFTRAGGVNIGKAGLSELAYSGLGINPAFGTPPNPLDAARIPGGSSSGSAAAVRVGLCAFSMGSDTSGSIRIPSAFQHLTGYKPSQRRFNRQQVFPLSSTLDEIGPIAATVQDCDDVTRLLLGQAPALSNTVDWRETPICVPEGDALADAEPAVATAFAAALQCLADAGAPIRTEPVPELATVSAAIARHGTFAAAESMHFHQPVLQTEAGQLIDTRVRERMNRALTMQATDYVALHAIRRQLMASLWQRYPRHVLLMPTVAMLPPLLAPLEADVALYHRINVLALRNTGYFNFLDAASISLPLPLGESGLPVGLMLSAAPGLDDWLLQVAHTAEGLWK